MNALKFPFSEAPVAAERVRVRAGIDWIQLPLPFALDHVNCWWLGDGDSACLIDTCIDASSSINLWRQLIAETGLPANVLVTHFHPDHMGLAGWFSKQGAQLIGSEIEVAMAQKIWQTGAEAYADNYANWYRQNGLSAEAVKDVEKKGNGYRRIVHQPPSNWRYVTAGDTIELGGQEFDVRIGRGHAPDMLMLYSQAHNVLIAADQVLPGISPNISLQPLAEDANPLQSFLHSLDELRDLPVDTLVLPSHGMPFTGLHLRLDALAEHHVQRCGEILVACQQPQSAADLFPVLFKRQLDAQQLSFALGESLAHLRYLELAGSIRVDIVDDVRLFQAD